MLHWFFFVGALAYADDLVLLAPTPSAMRQLLRIVMSMQMNLVSNLMQRSLNGWLLYLRSDIGYRLSWTFLSFMWVAVLLTGLVRLYILGILSILN